MLRLLIVNNRLADAMIASKGVGAEFGVLFVSGSVVLFGDGTVIGRVVLTGTGVVIGEEGRVVRTGVSVEVACGIPAGL